MDGLLTPEDIALLMRNLEFMPDSETCVHFDLHSSNIMIQNGEPIIIDIGDFSIGRYFFASLRIIFVITFLPKLREDCIKMMNDILLPRIRSAQAV